MGLQMSTVYDIGAFDGAWSVELARSLPFLQQFVLFEPNPAHRTALLATGFPHVEVLLGDQEREVGFYSTGGSGDSIYRERTGHFDTAVATTLRMRRLDAVVAERSLPAPQVLKLDVQGAELDVLRGATDTLRSVDVVYLEAPIVRYNSGAPRFDEYIDTLSGFDLLPYSVLEMHRIRHALVQVDMLFLSERAFSSLFGRRDAETARRLTRPDAH